MAKSNAKARKNSKSTRPYPRITLEDALRIPTAIKLNNGGNPWPPAEVANAIGVAVSTGNFFYKTSAAQAFGLTKGTREASKIELAPLGRAIVYAPDPASELKSKRQAFLNVEIFKKVFDHYQGSNLPETTYLGNTLENEFGLSPNFHEEFVKLFKENCGYVKMESGDTSGAIARTVGGNGTTKTTDSETIVLSEAKEKNAFNAFVIMPFSERSGKYSNGFFSEVLNSLVTPAAAEAGFTVKTARRTGSDVIQSTILNALIDADLVIADLTEHNPNVLFELGVRMAMEKPVLLIRAKGTDKIFDVDNMLRVFDYDPNLWTSTIKTDVPQLTEHVVASWELRTEKTYLEILKGANRK